MIKQFKKLTMKSAFACMLFFISTNVIGQKHDYLIKNNGDTVWGEITVKNMIFYVTGTSVSAINATDVSRVKSSKYKGNIVVTVNLLTYKDNLSDLSIDFIEKGATDTILILEEVYSTPKINLYYGTDEDKLPFYFYKTPADPKPVQLVIRYFLQGGLSNYQDNRPKYAGEKSRVYIVEDKGYVNQLYAIMGDCKKITQPVWDLLSYRSYSLKQVIKLYNKCD
jgi:hypothetical protein